jgi:hypothetical protein
MFIYLDKNALAAMRTSVEKNWSAGLKSRYGDFPEFSMVMHAAAYVSRHSIPTPAVRITAFVHDETGGAWGVTHEVPQARRS